jgi:hypothetical protein
MPRSPWFEAGEMRVARDGLKPHPDQTCSRIRRQLPVVTVRGANGFPEDCKICLAN